MLVKTKSWFANLTTISKIMIASGAVIIGGTAVGAASNSSNKLPITDDTGEVKGETTEKKAVIETKSETETVPIPFSKTTIEDGNLNKGTTEVRTAGVNGVTTKIFEVTYEDGKHKSKKLVSENVTTAPVAEVTAIGTYVYVPPKPEPQLDCDPNYSPCVPNVSYDLDCPDIGFSVSVVGYDSHGFDRDNDGYGCESY